MDLGIRIPTGIPITKVANYIKRCEDLGFTSVGVVDHQHSSRDVFITLALAAAQTSSITLYPAVSNPITRHSMVLASIAYSLEEIAPGRIMIPIGAGFHSVRNINHAQSTVAQMRITIKEIRHLLRGEEVYPGITEGKMTRLHDSPPPIYVCATGFKMTKLAGEVGDGGFLMTGIHPDNIEEARSLVAEGATLSGRDPSNIPLTFVSAIHMENDMEKAWEWSRPLCYNWIRDKQRAKWLLKAGVRLPEVEQEEDLTIDDLRKLCEVIGLFGTPEYCIDKIKSLETNHGVTSLFLQPTTTYDMPEETIEFLASSLQTITGYP